MTETQAKDQEPSPSFKLPPVEVVDILSIRPYHRNPRRNDSAVPAVKESLRRYGINQPLVVDDNGVIVVGHTRYRALLELGATQVPVVRPKLTPEQARAYRIADNKTGELAEWDKDALIPELRALGDPGEIMAVFFREKDLAKLLAESAGHGAQQAPVTPEQLDSVLNRRESALAERMRDRSSGHIRLECPGCGEQFYVNRETIETHDGDLT